MYVGNQNKKRQARFSVCLLFLYICVCLSACTGKQTEKKERLDVWFFACSDDADSILLQTDDTNVIIDTGLSEDSDALVRKLKEQDVQNVDLLILTHPDKDHIGGAEAVLDAFSVEQVMQTDFVKGSELQKALEERLLEENVLVPEEKMQLSYGELQMTIYPPGEEYESSNNNSIAALAEYEGKRFFFAGDAKRKRIEELLSEGLPQVDVYKAAHHGRDNGKSSELIERLSPEIAVVTAREPEEETARTFAQIGSTVYSTYESDVHFTVDGGILDVE
ncbi:MAG: MBL fold metallo-hydrolase [Lachnospiraceae bacterium]|nr:MBL fold metallo-hydrolase [Lachnospiraceae bacterium]